jgi:hypothetical protein
MLSFEPTNQFALNLRLLINDKARSEGVVGMTIVGAAIATVGVLAALFVKRR